jgi:hypothetical protein
VDLVNTINLEIARSRLLRDGDEYLARAARFCKARADQYCPVKSGYLKSTGRIVLVPGRSGGVAARQVTYDAPYAPFVEARRGFLARAMADTAAASPSIAASLTNS